MQRQYRIEIFDNEFNPIGTSPISTPYINVDYLSVQESEILCARRIDGIKPYYLAQIIADNGDILCKMLVSGCSYQKTAMTVYLRPLFSLLNVDGEDIDDGDGRGLWGYFVTAFRLAYAGSVVGETVNVPPTYAYIEYTQDEAIGAFSITGPKSSLNLLSLAQQYFQTDGVLFALSFDVNSKKITFDSRVVGNGGTLELDLDNVMDVEISDVPGVDSFNGVRMFVPHSKNGRYIETFVITDAGEIVRCTSDVTNYARPPVFKLTYEAAKDENYTEYTEDELKELASSHLSQNTEPYLITSTHAIEDKVFTQGMADIGKKYAVYFNGSAYNTRLSAVALSGDTKTLTFGCYRNELTKILNMKGRG